MKIEGIILKNQLSFSKDILEPHGFKNLVLDLEGLKINSSLDGESVGKIITTNINNDGSLSFEAEIDDEETRDNIYRQNLTATLGLPKDRSKWDLLLD